MNAKQARFVAEYIVDLNATQAAKRAGYGERTAYSQGQRLLKDGEIQAAIAVAQQQRSERTQVTADMVVRELARIGFSDIRNHFAGDNLIGIADLDDDAARAVASVEVVMKPGPPAANGERETEYVHKIKLWDKKGALDTLAKHLGMLVERHAGADGGPLVVRWEGG